MKTFYVSLVFDLIGVYLEYQAESEKAVRQYLEREYLRKGVWKMPWCAVYSTPPKEPNAVVIKAKCGTIYERAEMEA